MLDKEKLEELSKAKRYLCEYYGYKCFTSDKGKCPMTKHDCYDFPTISSMFQRINIKNKNNVANHLIESAKDVGYEVTE